MNTSSDSIPTSAASGDGGTRPNVRPAPPEAGGGMAAYPDDDPPDGADEDEFEPL